MLLMSEDLAHFNRSGQLDIVDEAAGDFYRAGIDISEVAGNSLRVSFRWLAKKVIEANGFHWKFVSCYRDYLLRSRVLSGEELAHGRVRIYNARTGETITFLGANDPDYLDLSEIRSDASHKQLASV